LRIKIETLLEEPHRGVLLAYMSKFGDDPHDLARLRRWRCLHV